MSNIHTLSDFRSPSAGNGSSVPYRAAPSANRPASSSQPSRFGTIGSLQPVANTQPTSGSYNEVGYSYEVGDP